LAFSQSLESITSDCAEMRKYVGAGFLLDKAKTLGFVEPFNGSGSSRHSHILFLSLVNMALNQGPWALVQRRLAGM
jgi:hypothetical protein